MTDDSSPLGDFLRARRERVDPAGLDLADYGRRRVTGLHQEELALLAGVSSQYYARLEQGRDRHPSAPVLEALARALQLDKQATGHLLHLGQPAAGAPPPTAAGEGACRGRAPAPMLVRPARRRRPLLGRAGLHPLRPGPQRRVRAGT